MKRTTIAVEQSAIWAGPYLSDMPRFGFQRCDGESRSEESLNGRKIERSSSFKFGQRAERAALAPGVRSDPASIGIARRGLRDEDHFMHSCRLFKHYLSPPLVRPCPFIAPITPSG